MRYYELSMPSKPRLVLVDDHELMLDGLSRILEKSFDLVGTAADGRAALEVFATLRPDVMLLDITLPVINGIEVARRNSGMYPKSKNLFVTMQTDRSYVRGAVLAGGLRFVLERR